jgi:hypothetical protein
MVVIAGSIVLVAALIVAIVGVLSNAGPTHPQTDFSMFGYHVTGSAGTLFALWILVGAVALLGLSGRMAGVRRTADRGRDAPLGRHHHAAATPLRPATPRGPPPPNRAAACSASGGAGDSPSAPATSSRPRNACDQRPTPNDRNRSHEYR